MKPRTLQRIVFAALAVAALAAVGGWWYWHVPSRYFPAAELDRSALERAPVAIPLPRDPAGVHFFGKLRLDLYIDEKGDVDRVEVLDGDVPPAYWQPAAEAWRRVKFFPAVRRGREVKSLKRVELEFAPPLRSLKPE
jgi:hypothetical protein